MRTKKGPALLEQLETLTPHRNHHETEGARLMSTENTTPALAEETQPIAVDARFAGGTIFVHAEPLPWDSSTNAVRLAMPGLDLPLQRHEARALPGALLRGAGPDEDEILAFAPHRSLAKLRREVGMTRRSLAKEAGFSRRELRRIEQGHLPLTPTDARFITLAIAHHLLNESSAGAESSVR